MTASALSTKSRLPSPSLERAFRRLRLVTAPASPSVAGVPAGPPAVPVAHPFSHDVPGARCPACELRAYLDA